MAAAETPESEDRRYTVGYSAKADRERADVARSSPKDWKRIGARIGDLARSPRPYGSEKLTDVEGYKLRVGGWRVIYTVIDKDRRVIVTRISRRREDTYKGLP